MSTYRLAFPEQLPSGAWKVTVAIGTECATKEQAELLLSDRIANGDAFPGEFVQSPAEPVGDYSFPSEFTQE